MSRRSLQLQAALAALAVLQVVHSLDSLRTDDEATLAGQFLAPPFVLGVGGSLVALVLVARRHQRANRFAVAVAWLVAAGFVVVHGVPFAAGPTEPYWGDGSADALQWLGVGSILACAALVGRFACTGIAAKDRPVTGSLQPAGRQ